jgi:hypothetical protein
MLSPRRVLLRGLLPDTSIGMMCDIVIETMIISIISAFLHLESLLTPAGWLFFSTISSLFCLVQTLSLHSGLYLFKMFIYPPWFEFVHMLSLFSLIENGQDPQSPYAF